MLLGLNMKTVVNQVKPRAQPEILFLYKAENLLLLLVHMLKLIRVELAKLLVQKIEFTHD